MEKKIGSIYSGVYRKSSIGDKRFQRERNQAFVIMPFESEHSNSLWEFLKGICSVCGLTPRRADQTLASKPIISDIFEEIEKSEIIIADLTGLNPNVLYEVGISHMASDSVILICQKGQTIPFDLAGFRCIFFDLSTEKMKREFRITLMETLDALRSVEIPKVIESAIERTNILINDMQSLSDLSQEELKKETVWFSGSLSAFAIDEDEHFDSKERDYHNALLLEKASLLSLAHKGCLIRCIISPQESLRLFNPDRKDMIQHRLNSLLKFMESNDKALEKIDWVISPFRQKTLYIIGHISCMEGFRKGLQRGSTITLRQTDLNAISAQISLYKALFEFLLRYTLMTYVEGEKGDMREILRLAAINCLKTTLGSFNSEEKG